MNANDIPVGQSVVINDDENIKSTFTRTSVGEGVLEQFAPEDGRRVLKTTVSIPAGSTRVDDIDYSFWTVLLDGKPLPPGTPAKGDINSDPKTRTINITSS